MQELLPNGLLHSGFISCNLQTSSWRMCQLHLAWGWKYFLHNLQIFFLLLKIIPPKNFQLKTSNTCNTVQVLYEASCRKENTRLQNFRKKTLLQVKEGWSWLHCPLLYNLCILNWVFWAFTFEFFPGNFVESDERFYICAQFWIVIPSVIFQSALPNPIRREGTVFEGKMLILEIFSFVQCLIWGRQKLKLFIANIL